MTSLTPWSHLDEVEAAMEILAAGSLTDIDGREVPTTLVERARNVVDALAAETDARRDLEEENARLRAELLPLHLVMEIAAAWESALVKTFADGVAQRQFELSIERELRPPIFVGWIDPIAEEAP